MARHTHFAHGSVPKADYEITERNPETHRNGALCGADLFMDTTTHDIKGVTCSKCSAAWGKMQNKDRDLGITIVKPTEDDHEGLSFHRSAYVVNINDQPRAYVTFDGGGRRSHWVIRDWGRNVLTRKMGKVSFDVHLSDVYNKRFTSKEEAAVFVVDNIELFITRDDYMEKQEQARKEYRAAVAVRQQKKEERIADAKLAVETLETMRNGRELSNLETAAISTALKALEDVLELEG